MRLFDALLDLVLPQRCAGCASAAGPACPTCVTCLKGAASPCPPTPAPSGLPPPYAITPYEGAVRRLIVAHKERGRTALSRPLGAALATAVLAATRHPTTDTTGESATRHPTNDTAEENNTRHPTTDRAGENDIRHPTTDTAGESDAAWPVLVVPVPSSRASIRQRGHDPMWRLAEAATHELRRGGMAAHCVRALTHRRPVTDQAGLGTAARQANLAGALTATRPLNGQRIILVDDIITTGATLAEAARALQAVGAQIPATAVIAATPRHHPSRQHR